jgi:hypothetical protein
MNKLLKLALAVSSLAFTSTAHAQLLNQILGKLLTPAAATQPVTTEAPYNSPTNAGFALLSPAQAGALDKLLNLRSSDKALAQMVASAKPILRRAVMASACASEDVNLDALNDVILQPKSHKSTFLLVNQLIGKSGMKYHDPRQCVTVTRIMGWKRLAANVLAVDIFYMSPSSNEATHQTFKFRKVADGGWLIDDIGYAFS